jgi:hypothetical protein
MADGQAEEERHTGQTAEDCQTMERDSEAEIESRRQDEERRRPDSLSLQPSAPILNSNDPLAPLLPQAQHVSPAPHGSAPDSDSESLRLSGSNSIADGQAEEECRTGQTAEDHQTMERDSQAVKVEGGRQSERREGSSRATRVTGGASENGDGSSGETEGGTSEIERD